MRLFSICLALLLFGGFSTQEHNDRPNILIIIADDVGVDSWSRSGIGSNMAATPRLDALADQGVSFSNAWATPTCSPTRAAILTGLYGSKNGVLEVGNTLDLSFETLFESINTLTNGAYAIGAFGKWHLGARSDASHPTDQGADSFHGYLGGGPGDYSSWSRVSNGRSDTSTEYVTSEITSEAISWIDQQTSPWLVWMAHGAAHTPFHEPPDSLYSRAAPIADQDLYLAMIESLDHETGRLLDSMTAEELDNTLIVFIGDNGTPVRVLQAFPDRRGKGSLYQGGLNVPMFVTGSGVGRKGETDTALVHVMDMHATILDILGADFSGGVNNSFSFADRLMDGMAPARPYLLSENRNDFGTGFAIRNEQFKVIQQPSGVIEMFDVLADPFELDELNTLTISDEHQVIRDELIAEAEAQVNGWSCNDGVVNGSETATSCAVNTSMEFQEVPKRLAIESVYPNPTSGTIFLSLDIARDWDRVSVFTIAGKKVLSTEVGNGVDAIRVSLEELTPGVYLIYVQSKDPAEAGESVLVTKI